MEWNGKDILLPVNALPISHALNRKRLARRHCAYTGKVSTRPDAAVYDGEGAFDAAYFVRAEICGCVCVCVCV